MTPLLIGGIGMPELILIVLVVLLLFGGKKIPEMMHGMGKGVKSFKDGMNGIEGPDTDDAKADAKQDSEPASGAASGAASAPADGAAAGEETKQQ